MENKLIKTDTIWYKIKSFFRKIFFKRKESKTNIYEVQEEQKLEETKEEFIKNISFREELQITNKKEEMAEKLITGELDVYDLSDEQVDEMTEYFTKDIEEIDKELLRIKEHIISMKKKLANQ